MTVEFVAARALAFTAAPDKTAFLNELRAWVHEVSSTRSEPVGCVLWVPVENVRANGYNPNATAVNEMRLLHTSISADGYTQPVVVVRDEEGDGYVVVDGFHRSTIMRQYEDIRQRTGGLLPVVVLEKTMAERMAATVRHNRARGKH